MKRNTLILLVYSIFLFSKLQSRLEIPFYDDDLVIVGFSFFMLLAIITSGAIGAINKYIYSSFIILVLYVTIYYFMPRIKYLSPYIDSHIIAFLGYAISVFSLALYSVRKRCVNNVLLFSYVIITLFVFSSYVMNFDNFESIKTLSTTFIMSNIDKRELAYGFAQANTTADICIAGLLIRFLFIAEERDGYIRMKKGERLILNIFAFVLAFILFSTMSRGGMLSVIAMLMLNLYLNLGRERANNVKIRMLFAVMFAILVAFVVWSSMVQTGKLDADYRISNFTVNIPTLIRADRLWMGWGFVDKAVFAHGLIINGTGYTDNYFLYVLVSTGIIGCLFVVAYIASLINAMRKQLFFFRRKFRNAIWGIFAADLVFCLTQAAFINPASIFSFITMFIFVSVIAGWEKTQWQWK